MEELFFVIDPVWWTGSLSWISIGVASVAGICFSVYFLKKSGTRQTHNDISIPQEKFLLTPVGDVHFAETTLSQIRIYLSHIYSPMHSWAHISRDITSYISDIQIIDIINQLESSEYSTKHLSIEQQELINRELSIYFQK